MSRFEGPQGIVTNGLVLNLDAGDPDSYTRSQPPYVEVLVVAGGASGGSSTPSNGGGGGGGAGGVIYNSAYQLASAAAVTVTVGAGGAGQTTNDSQGNDGSNSVFGSLTAVGGGGGGGAGVNTTGRNGGSGGGAGYAGYYNNFNSGTGTAGQGFRGGYVLANNNGGGGGGAGGVGGDTFDSRPEPGYPAGNGGLGGSGVYYSISGTSTLYSNGGNGGSQNQNTIVSGSGTTGAYGGSGATSTAGSGIVIVRYPGLPAATGGTITYLNGYTIHTFTSSGTFTPYKWNDLTGTGYNTTLSNNVFDPPVGTMLFTNGIAKYLPGGTLTDFPNTPSANATIVILSTIKAPDSDWKTLVRGATADHQVIINQGDGVTLGMYDNNNAGFISSGFDFSTISDRTTAYHVYFWKLSQSSPYYQFYYDNNTSSPSGIITNAAATFNNGFACVGAYHDSSSDPNQFSQEWGNIKVFLYYNRHLSQAEMDQIYNTLKLRR